MSAARAMFMPAPAAAPFTAAITGWGMVRILRTICMPARSSGSSSCVAPLWRPFPSAPRSPPAQKARPEPVMTTTRTASSAAKRLSASLTAIASSLFSAFNRSGRFITSVAMPSCFASTMTGPACAGCGALLMSASASVSPGVTFFFNPRYKLRQFPKMLQFLVLARGVRAAGGGQNVDARAVKQLFLNAKLAFALGKLFVCELPVEGHNVRREFLELLRQHDAAFGKIFAHQFFHAPCGALDKVGEPNPEFNHTLVVVVIERFRHHAALVEHGPELIPASGVVMTDAHGRLTRIATDDHELHAFAQMVWEGSHGASLLCLSIFLLALEMGCALFDIGGQTFLGVLTGEEQLLEFTLDAQGFTKRNFRTGHYGSLDPADRARGLIGRTELLGIGHDILPVGFAFINVVNQTHPQGFFEAEDLAPHYQFERLGAADDAREALGAAGARQDSKIHLGEANLPTFFPCDSNVAGQRDFQAAADGVPVESRDDQLGSLLKPAKRLVGVQTEVVLESRIGLREHGNAGPSAEKFVARPANQQDVNTLIHARLEDGRVELLHHLVAIGVCRRIVQFEYGDSPFKPVFHEFFRVHCQCRGHS